MPIATESMREATAASSGSVRELGVRALGGGDALSPESLAGFELAADLRAFLAVPPSVLARFALPARS